MKPVRTRAEQFRDELSSADVERLWGGLEGAQRRRAQRRTLVRSVAASTAVAAVVALVVTSWPRPQPGALTSTTVALGAGTTVAPPVEGLTFDDGSQVRSVGALAELEVVRNEPTQFSTLLRKGSIHVRVTPGGPRRWSIDTPLATVEVVGTEFEVEQSSEALLVRVDHGIVLVRGERVPGRVRRLTAGETLEVHAAEAVPSQQLDDILDRAAEARRERRLDEAQRLLREGLPTLTDASERATLALEFARTALDEQQRPVDALPLLAEVQQSGAAPALVERAMALEVRALAQAGRTADARRVAERYEALFPAGPWREEVRRWAP